MKTLAILATAALAAVIPQTAAAVTIFSNDFTQGIGPTEDLIGRFTVADGYAGHHGGYENNEYSSYRIIQDFSGYAKAFIDFDYWINSEFILDGVQLKANDVVLGGFTGNGYGHARFALDNLTQPGVVGRSVIAFDFTSSAFTTFGGFQFDNLVIAGDVADEPVAGVPEPATWAMMLLGFCMVAAASRYRRRSAKLVFA